MVKNRSSVRLQALLVESEECMACWCRKIRFGKRFARRVHIDGLERSRTYTEDELAKH